MEIKNKRSKGTFGEDTAIEYLKNCGFFILKKNFRVGKMGEIDIIAREKEYVCFIEVKSRKSLLFGSPAEAVNRKKQDNIRRLACIYINQNKLFDSCIRFDVVELILNYKDKSVKEINLIRNAF